MNMTYIDDIKNRIDNFCKDEESALALYLRYFAPLTGKIFGELYGISEDKINHAFNVIIKDNSDSFSKSDYTKNVIECINKFSTELKTISRERVRKLSSFEIDILSFASYYIMQSIKINDQYKYDIAKRNIVPISENRIAQSIRSIYKMEYKEVIEIIEKLLAKTGLAFYNGDKFSDVYVVPPYAEEIINELAFHTELKFMPFIDMIRNSNDTKLISAILVAINGNRKENAELFERVYGENFYKYIQSIGFPLIQNSKQGNSRYFIAYDILMKPLFDKASPYIDKITRKVTNFLTKNDFEITWVKEPGKYSLIPYGEVRASKDYTVFVHITPFFYKYPEYVPADNRIEKEVVVLIGPIANPDKIKGYVVVELDNNLNVIRITDNVNEDWSKEITEIFKFLNDPTSSKTKKDIVSEKDIITKINVYKTKSKEILESVVASVFDRFGFMVNVDRKIRTISGIDTEVDVWALKGSLKVYVSCKNYNGNVGVDVISNEIGRVSQLSEIPTMKILVFSNINKNAKKIAEKNGFLVIELGFQVNDKNIINAYNKIYDELKKYFWYISTS